MLDAPDVPEAETKSAVRWRLKDFLDYPVDAATVDVIRIPPDPSAPTKARSVFAVSARNEHIAARMKQNQRRNTQRVKPTTKLITKRRGKFKICCSIFRMKRMSFKTSRAIFKINRTCFQQSHYLHSL